MYSEKVMDHFNNPRNVGEIENPSGVGTVGNAKCGDIMRMYLDIDDNGIIQEAKFKTFGCGGNQQYGNRACKGQDDPGSTAGNQQGRYGSTRRTSTSEGALLPAGRGSNSCCFMGLCRETQYQDRGIRASG